jgi:hypothetical protein
MASRNPRLVITVTTTVLPARLAPLGQVEGEQGQELVAVVAAPVVVDGQQPVGVAVEGQPRSACCSTTARRPASSGWVDPQPALMLVPSGSQPMATTSAPSRS